MSEETQGTVEEAIEMVEEAQSQKVFNLSDAIKGRAYPQKEVTIYLDDEAAMKLADLDEEMSVTLDEKKLAGFEKLAKPLSEKVKASSLTFKMRGVSQEAIESTLKKVNEKYKVKGSAGTENPDWMRDYITHLVGMNIVSVADATGAVDDGLFDFEKADELRLNVPAAEWGKLVEMMQKLTLAGGYFDQLTDAGFLPRS